MDEQQQKAIAGQEDELKKKINIVERNVKNLKAEVKQALLANNASRIEQRLKLINDLKTKLDEINDVQKGLITKQVEELVSTLRGDIEKIENDIE